MPQWSASTLERISSRYKMIDSPNVNEFDQIGVLYMAIKSFIVKFDTIECVSLLVGCCNIKIWSYKLNQVNFSWELGHWCPGALEGYPQDIKW